MTWPSAANRSRMLPPVEVVPAWSKALRYSRATDLRCSSVIVWIAIAMSGTPRLGGAGSGGGQLGGWSTDRLAVGGLGGAVGEGDDRAEGGAAGPVGLGRRRGDAVADPVEARDRPAGVVQDLRLRVRTRAALRVQGAPGDEAGVVGPLAADRPHGRVGPPGLLL